ncbi:MAG: MGMT family protein [Candidatus Woesearchaeota archaeon]|jgi:methylated-DNA-[protein]-cysteine S-methyltransferase|nr:MGMT family protein [Candidatus Woesearchaeota archaeon]
MKSFSERVYDELKRVPKGKVTTYKELALRLNTRAYRAVGTTLGRNPYAPQVPCHRVINSNGKIGGFMHGTDEKIRLLESEGIEIKNNKVINFKKVLFEF